MLISATSYSDLFLFPLLKMTDVYQTVPGEVPPHTSTSYWACGAAPGLLLPLGTAGPDWSGDT